MAEIDLLFMKGDQELAKAMSNFYPPIKQKESVWEGLFNENMTPTEARIALFTAIEGKSEEEIHEIEREFERLSSRIIQKDLEGNCNYMTSDYITPKDEKAAER